MKRLFFLFALAIATMASAVTVSAQERALLHFEQLNGLESKARDVVEVNVDGKLLELAKRVSQKVNNADGLKVREALKDLRAIYVRVYRFDQEGQYNPADVDQIRSQLSSPGWEKLANVHSKQNDQKVDVFTMFTGDRMDGLAVVMSDSKSVAVVNVVGMIDIETLVELSGKLNIPRMNIDVDPLSKPKEK
jgi:hypothetical protein